jgi:DNA-binding beta-propeller fold protein YncE
VEHSRKSKDRRPGVLVVAVLVLWAVTLFAAAVLAAASDPGELAQLGCISEDGPGGCTSTPHTDFRGTELRSGSPDVADLAISPDGKVVFVGSTVAVNLFDRAADGSLASAGCVSRSRRCAHSARAPLSLISGIAVSPDGQNVYVTAGVSPAVGLGHEEFGGDALVAFRRTAAGTLKSIGCIAERGQGRRHCAREKHGVLRWPKDLAVSADGRNVYVVSASSLTAFTRSGDGRVGAAGCFVSSGRSHGCRRARRGTLSGVESVAISPDGGSVYVLASKVLDTFERNGNGRLTFAGCVANQGAYGCEDLPDDSLGDWDRDYFSGEGAQVAVSHDGRSVYVTSGRREANSQTGDSVTAFARDPDGRLSQIGCIADGGATGCVDPLHDSLYDSLGIAVSPGGESVYIGSKYGVSRFTRGADGALIEAGCIADGGREGCLDPPYDSLQDSSGIAVSPDGGLIYVVGDGVNVLQPPTRSFKGDRPKGATAVTEPDQVPRRR